MGSAILKTIRDWLDREGVTYRHLQHEATYTSEQSAAARGEDVRIGGKALLLKTGEVFRLFVLSAALKIDSGAVRRRFSIRHSRFATKEELLEQTGLVPGSVPPFGEPILPFELHVDESIARNDRIAFNAGSLTDSIIMSTTDYLRLANPTVFLFSVSALK